MIEEEGERARVFGNGDVLTMPKNENVWHTSIHFRCFHVKHTHTLHFCNLEKEQDVLFGKLKIERKLLLLLLLL